MNTISKLCEWFERQCVDDWHESYGVKIDTLDNPGWLLKIDLKGTSLQHNVFKEIRVERSNQDWIVARRDEDAFESFGGPRNLEEMIVVFLNWVDLNSR